MTTTATHCPYCAFQCGLSVTTGGPAGRALQVVADETFPVNRGQMCIKGHTAGQLLDQPDRLRTPMMRGADGVLAPVSWDTALDFVAARLLAIREEHGAPALAAFGSGALTNEKAYVLGKFARLALRTPNIDYNGRYCMASAAAGQNLAFGLDRGLPFPLADVSETDTLMLWGSNCAETMPPIMQWIYAQRDRGGQLIVVDPRATETARAAALHLQITPGTDLALANALLHIAIRDGRVDPTYVAERTEGFDEVRRAVLTNDPTMAERVTGVAVEQQVRAVRMLADVERSMVLSGRGSEQQSKGTDTVLALINLMLALGKVGKPFSGYGCITGQGNGQGGREHGQKADQLPGYRLIENPEHRAEIARIWKIDPADLPGKGKSAYELTRLHGANWAGSGRSHGGRVERGGRVSRSLEHPPEAPCPRPARRLRRVRERDDGGGACRPARRAVGGRRRDDDEPRGTRDLASASPAPSTRRADGPRRDARARRTARRGIVVRLSLAQRRLRRAPLGDLETQADYSGITYERIRRERGDLLAVPPTSSTQARRAPLRRALRCFARAAARASGPSRIDRRPRAADALYPLAARRAATAAAALRRSGSWRPAASRRSWRRNPSRACR